MERIDAIYARQSVDRMDSISIESQIQYCEYETRGGEYKVYQDKGYSGKNMDRPEFQQMMDDIRSGTIKRVICYKLDRVSRSILDFANTINEFQKYEVEFVSCTEKFDTSTPMGRAMLNICIVFAQLERETIQQRVTDAYNSRSRRGFYMGGRIPYGYRLEPYTIDGKNTSRYVINPEEAEVIKLIYKMYAQPQVSYSDIVKHLIKNNIQNTNDKHGCWDKAHIADMIKNPIYVQADLDVYNFFKEQGSNLHNNPEDYIGINGCYLYAEKSAQRKHLSLKDQHVVLAPHEGIVSSDEWIRARKKCLNNAQVAKPLKARNSWLAGKIKCGKCGYALTVRKANTRVGRYFVCSRRSQTLNGCEGVHGIYALEIENTILEQMKERLKEFDTLSEPQHTPDSPKIAELTLKLTSVQNEIDNLMGRLSQASDVLMEYINSRISDLDKQKKQYQTELYEYESSKANAEHDIRQVTNYMDHWEDLTTTDKIAVVDLLIAVIKVTEDNIDIVWKI